ncbi:hypothetical protein [Halorussus sp. MSC15.2]|uniref:hypothetical protein n=1 Tax=Halorussus sp. MSC15.2 TaxID=2283638 RepID=UPI0013D0247D|nr:hypothetical protein [Halorussus sp. MSC15.2]NEU56330.1 hypothetical protein [Halorussus sp. MSC15.2]
MRGTDRDTDRGTVERGSSDPSFESELEALVLRAFGEGEDVEGVWDLEYEPEELPDWTVTIDRKDGI